MTNKQIYLYNENLAIFSQQTQDIKMPVRINFYLQKNIETIQRAAGEIQKARLMIGAMYGTPNEEGNGYSIPADQLDKVNSELNDLLNLEQEINIHKFKLEDFDGIELTCQQMQAIMFMIEE